jgi:hypothetical protein
VATGVQQSLPVVMISGQLSSPLQLPLRDPSATVQQKVEDDLVAKAVDQPPALRGSEGRRRGRGLIAGTDLDVSRHDRYLRHKRSNRRVRKTSPQLHPTTQQVRASSEHHRRRSCRLRKRLGPHWGHAQGGVGLRVQVAVAVEREADRAPLSRSRRPGGRRVPRQRSGEAQPCAG